MDQLSRTQVITLAKDRGDVSGYDLSGADLFSADRREATLIEPVLVAANLKKLL